MPRQTIDQPITTRAARERLAVRPEPYWRAVDTAVAVGYRKARTGGTWIARAVVEGRYREGALGRADDAIRADGLLYLDYRQAVEKARAWATRQHHVAAGLDPRRDSRAPYAVADAIRDYLADYEARGGKALVATKQAADAHILPALGALPVERLTRERLKSWHRALAAAKPRLRSRRGEQKHRDTTGDPDAPRRRRSTANRVLTVLKAALNHARVEGKVTCPPDAWTATKPFREADKAKVRYLLDDESKRLVNACPPDFRELVTAALVTGCRYGELAAMTAGDFDPQGGTVTIARSKGGKPRHVALDYEGQTFFARIAAGKGRGVHLFQRGETVRQATRDAPAEIVRATWGKSEQFRFMREACAVAKIVPAITFHELRHTYATRLAMRGVPMGVIAAQLGHADTRMTERHYAHLAPSYVAETVRAALQPLGIVLPSNVATLPARAVG